MLFLRKEQKKHGAKKLIEGNFNNGAQTGLWKYYNNDGTLDGTEEY